MGNSLSLLLLLYGLLSHDGVSPSLAKVSMQSEAARLYFIAIWIVHGLFQSVGGPLVTAVMVSN